MSNRLPFFKSEMPFLCYLLGLPLFFALTGYGLRSILLGQSYALDGTWRLGHFDWSPVPAQGRPALLVGVAYEGFALLAYAFCFAQYRPARGFFYDQLFTPGLLIAGAGLAWCGWLFLRGVAA